MKITLKSVVFNMLVLCATQVLTDWQSCTPCQCSLSNQFKVKHADCSRETTGFIVTKVPNNLDPEIESVSLKEQILRRIEEEAFSTVHLKIVNLEKCKIITIYKNAFKNLANLSYVNLANNEIVSLHRDTFKFNKNLQSVRLNNNKFKSIDDGLFAGLTLLSKLYLNDNKINVIHRLAFEANVNIKSLFLQNNQLSNIDSHLTENLPLLFEIYLDGNPWICDCYLRKLFEDLHNRQFFYLNAQCQEPEKFRGLAWIDLSSIDFSCSLNATWNESITKMVVYNDTVSLSCTVEAFPEPICTWMYNGDVINSQEHNLKYQFSKTVNHAVYTNDMTIYNITSTDNGEYKCKMHNTDQEKEKSFILSINPARIPVILFPNASVIAVDVYTENFVLSCKVSGIPAPSVTWLIKDYNIIMDQESISKYAIPGTDSYWSNLTFPAKLALHNGGHYTCVATNSKGSVSKTILLKIRQLQPPRLIETAEYYSSAELSNVTLGCGVTAVPKPQFYWKYGVLPLDPHMLTEKYLGDVVRDKYSVYWYNLTILNLQMEDSGEYHCVANNSDGFEEKIIKIHVKEADRSSHTEPFSIIIIIIVGCGLFGFLLVIVLVKCCSRYYVTKNSSHEILFRQSYKT